jgi:hypothetical protein
MVLVLVLVALVVLQHHLFVFVFYRQRHLVPLHREHRVRAFLFF